MAIKLNQAAFDHAKRLIEEGQFLGDDRDAWSEHQPSTQEENEFIRRHGMIDGQAAEVASPVAASGWSETPDRPAPSSA